MKRFLLLFVFVGMQTLALAQTSYDRLRFGLQLTPNFSWVSPQSRFTNAESSGFGFGYGLMAEYKLTDNYFFHSGFGITQLSHFLSLDSNTYRTPASTQQKIYNVNYRYRLQYIEIPLAIKMRTNQIGAIRMYGTFGVEAGILVQGKAQVKNGSPIFDPDEFFFINRSEDEVLAGVTFSDNVNVFRMSLLMGAGIEYLLSGNTHLLAGVRFNNPFTEQFSGPQMTARVPYTALHLGIFF